MEILIPKKTAFRINHQSRGDVLGDMSLLKPLFQVIDKTVAHEALPSL